MSGSNALLSVDLGGLQIVVEEMRHILRFRSLANSRRRNASYSVDLGALQTCLRKNESHFVNLGGLQAVASKKIIFSD